MQLEKYKFLFDALENIEFGTLEASFPDGSKKKFASKNTDQLNANIKVNDLAMLDEVIKNGDIGFGETYMDGLWESDDLPTLIEFFIKNSHSMEDFFHANKFKLFLLAIYGLFKRNSKKGSKSNISYHYDLGNDFYSLWLDESMTYSSGIFDSKQTTLNQSQENKYRRILDKINPGNILEIGCGWGSFATRAAKEGNAVKGLTLSQEQAKYAKEQIAKENLSDKIQIALQDYRDENGEFDSIVSIEMFEAVGKKYWDNYFNVLNRCLKKNGKAMIQVITICDDVYHGYKKRTDFIQKHIFPGGYLPSKDAFRQLAKNHDLKITDEFAFGADYSKTLLKWLENFDNNRPEIMKLGYDEQFIRKWRFYLAYCAAGFAQNRTDVVQFLIEK